MDIGRRIFILVMAAWFLSSCVSLNVSRAERREFSGVDPRVFDRGRVVEVARADKEIVSPAQKWKWLNNWHLIRVQPGFLGTGSSNRPYTVSRSVNKAFMKTYPWPFYCYYLHRGEVAEKYDGGVYALEKKIKKVRGHSASISRIDKLGPGVYVATYVRSPASYKRFHLRQVNDFPPFRLGSDVTLSDDAILFPVKVKSFDPYKRAIYDSQIMKLPISNIILLNPGFFDHPMELEDVFIPYDFFRDKFIYDHPKVINKAEDPMVIKATARGVIVRFRKSAVVEEL